MIGKLVASSVPGTKDSCCAVMEFDLEPEINTEEKFVASASAAVREYLSTEEGKKVARDICSFNWGDAIEWIPDNIWEKYGLSPIPQETCLIGLVDHERILCPDR